MANPFGNPSSGGYYSAEQPGYSQWATEPESGPRLSHRHWTLAVALLGLCSYLVSYGTMPNVGGIDWDVRFAVLAALVAGFGLVPGQTPAAKVVAALAAIGFLDALSRLIGLPDGTEAGWALWVLVVLNALQTAAGLGALLTQPSTPDGLQAWYAAYAEQYAQSAAQYWGQYAQESEPDSGYQTSAAQAVQSVSAPERDTAHQEASYTDFVGGHAAEQAGGQVSGQQNAPASPGLPSVGHSSTPAQGQQVAAEPEYRTSSQ
ncbi:hypothetical protein A9W99_23230 [Mycobacterium sp. 1164966.3]|uniref:DUF5336 domain-containing protein n=1 Tax=Mycobacterium sp. 1164966.3 TaxID=1856861 RepID=UPI0007FDBC32|nr:DUF5336 domain-containing protein [Mycobacterium sp. 1164966.3]OBA78586.1 hypothetical protein A9W99_23230 [Mycobacterium sp. 1164966.3]